MRSIFLGRTLLGVGLLGAAGCQVVSGINGLSNGPGDGGTADSAATHRDGGRGDGSATSKRDASMPDAHTPDAHVVDAHAIDALPVDAHTADARPDVTAPEDAGRDAGEDAGHDATSDAIADAPPPVLVSGSLEYLQTENGPVMLANGASTQSLTADGTFMFEVAAGASYDITVTSQPAGQHCWVTGGSGVAMGMVPAVTVKCTLVAQALEQGTTMSTLAANTGLAALPGNSAVTVNVPVATTALLVLQAANVTGSDPGHVPSIELGFLVDASPVGLVVQEPVNMAAGGTSVSTYALVPLAKGMHTIQGAWANVSTTQSYSVNGTAFTNEPIGTEVDVIALESLPNYASSSQVSLEMPTLAADTDSLGPYASLTTGGLAVSAGAVMPAFLAATIPNVYGDRVQAAVALDGTPLAAGGMTYDVNNFRTMSFTPAVVTPLSAGAHTVDAEWARVLGGKNTVSWGGALTNDVTLNPSPVGELLSVLFNPSTAYGAISFMDGSSTPVTASSPISSSWQSLNLGGVIPTVSNDGTAANPEAMSFTITTSRPSHALVTLHSSFVRPTSSPQLNNFQVDLGLFVNGSLASAAHVWVGDVIDDYDCQAETLTAVVPLNSGSNSLAIQMRYLTEESTPSAVTFGVVTPGGLTTFSYVVLDDGP